MLPEQFLASNSALFEALVEKVTGFMTSGHDEEALRWALTAGWFASREGWFGELSSRSLEMQLIRAAGALPTPVERACKSTRPRWVHVVTEAYGTLGHSNLCRRWIEFDTRVSHDLVLVAQRGSPPARLAQAAEKSGGRCIALDPASPLLLRAQQLRAYVWQHADVVALHTHPEDVIATAALGIEGGPPVLLINHSDHSFWIGCSVADLVLDIRNSGHSWTKQARGVQRAEILPLPLFDYEQGEPNPCGANRLEVRRKFGIPHQAPLLLTVGSAAKYRPAQGLSFLETALRILARLPGAYLLAVGPENEGPWQVAHKRTNGRLLAVGRQPDASVFCQAADVYLEGFPAGSLTALYEAGEAGLACVRCPAQVIPPFASDGPALGDIPQPEDVEDYVARAVALAANVSERTELGRKLQQAIRAHHGRDGWLRRLNEIKTLIPEKHSVYPDFEPRTVDQYRKDWLLQYSYRAYERVTPASIAERVFVEAWKNTNTKPRVHEDLWCSLISPKKVNRRSLSKPLKTMEKFALWRLNRRIRRRGTRAQLMAKARLAINFSKRGEARKLVYSCLASVPSSLCDLEWVKVFLKCHFNSDLLRQFKRFRASSA